MTDEERIEELAGKLAEEIRQNYAVEMSKVDPGFVGTGPAVSRLIFVLAKAIVKSMVPPGR